MAALTLLRCHLIWATSVSHRQVLSPVWSCFLKQAGLDHSLGSGYCTYWGGLTRLATQAIFSLPSPRCFGSKSACLPQKWSIGFLQPQGGSSSLCKTSWPGLPVSGPNCSSPHCPHNLPFHELAQMAKRLPAMRETWVLSLGWEDPLEKEMTTHSSTVAWKIPWIEDPGRLQSMWLQRVRHDWATSLSSFFFFMNLLLEAQVQIWSRYHFSSLRIWLHVDLSYSPRLYCSLTVFSESCSICKCIFDIMVGEADFHVFYFTILISSPKCNVYMKNA